MVERDIVARGVTDPLVVSAMRNVPRELFVPEAEASSAYVDAPLPIGAGQTISQPYIVAYMIAAMRLRRGGRVLEIGAGSGYAAAVLAEIADEVFAIERIEVLAEMARDNLARAGYTQVLVRHGDGTQGWPEAAPFDGILVSAGAPTVPQTLMRQLSIGGRLVVPVGRTTSHQRLLRITRTDEETFHEEELAPVRFVPLIGAEGWDPRTTMYQEVL